MFRVVLPVLVTAKSYVTLWPALVMGFGEDGDSVLIREREAVSVSVTTRVVGPGGTVMVTVELQLVEQLPPVGGVTVAVL